MTDEQSPRAPKDHVLAMPGGRYAPLVANGTIKLKAATSSDVGRIPQFELPANVDPLDVLQSERAADNR